MSPQAVGRSTWRRKSFIAAGVGLGTLLLLEVIARVALGGEFVQGEFRDPTWAPCGRYDPDFGWTNRPGARVHVVNPRFGYHVRVNEQGFRDRVRTLAPAHGVRRVLLLGDSMSWGWGVEEGERFSDLLEQRLGAEVLNFGVPGYGTDQELWLLERRGLAFAPDVVLLGFVLNDVSDVQRKAPYHMFKPVYRRDPDGNWQLTNHPAPPSTGRAARIARDAWYVLSANSALCAWINAHARTADETPEPASPTAGPTTGPTAGHDGEESQAYVLPVHVGEEQVRSYCENLADPDSATTMLLARIAATCREHGIPLLVFSMPHNHDQYIYNPGAAPPAGVADPETLLAQRLREAGARIGFQTVSIDRALFAAAHAGTNLDCGDGHYNAAGNRVVADALEPELRKLLAALPPVK